MRLMLKRGLGKVNVFFRFGLMRFGIKNVYFLIFWFIIFLVDEI